MRLTGVHLLLTYRCLFECDHCFVWGSPRQTHTMSFDEVDEILAQALALASVEWIYFEGGEPFLFAALLEHGVDRAVEAGFRVGVVSNAYWATDARSALTVLEPYAGRLDDLSLSGDRYHGDDADAQRVEHARAAAQELGIPHDVITIAMPGADGLQRRRGQLPPGTSAVRYRGRASSTLAEKADQQPAESFDECPYENLVDPERVHVDPLGWVHICQGVTIGNLLQTSLTRICAGYDGLTHPIVGPLLTAGPVGLARQHDLPCEGGYADACHLCYQSRERLRGTYPEALAPDAVYGVFDSTVEGTATSP